MKSDQLSVSVLIKTLIFVLLYKFWELVLVVQLGDTDWAEISLNLNLSH